MGLKWIVVAILAVLPVTAMAEGDTRRIKVVGEGQVSAEPDMATIGLGVVSEGSSARDAIDENSAAMASVLERLKDAGIAEADIQTAGFTVSPRFDYERGSGENRITGFVAQNSVSVDVRDIDQLGGVLDAVADAGANSFQSLNFGLSDPTPAEDQARAAAVAEGQRRAVLYAEAADVTLGALMHLSDAATNAQRPGLIMQAERAAASGVPVASGELTITARVTMIYAIE